MSGTERLEADLVAANAALGQAVVDIGCAAGLPAGTSAADIEARVAELAASAVSPAGMVREFHERFSCPIGEEPSRPLLRLRQRLIREERREFVEAFRTGDLEAIARELADLAYVTYGTAVSLGIDLDAAVRAVHAANMAKLGPDGRPILRADGKVLRPEGWTPPDMSGALPAGRPA